MCALEPRARLSRPLLMPRWATLRIARLLSESAAKLCPSALPPLLLSTRADGTEHCASSQIGGHLGGLEFERQVAFGDGFGASLQCRQTLDDPENALLRHLINTELRIELAWTKADAPFLTSNDEEWPSCEWFASSPELNFTCTRDDSNNGFGILQIGRPADRNRTVPDVIGVRLVQERGEAP